MRIGLLIFLIFIIRFLPAVGVSNSEKILITDTVNEDYTENKLYSLHTRGLFTYGLHMNTFHLRNYFIRANFNYRALQVFASVAGYMDTHDPAQDYGFILDNIKLYDYGIQFHFARRILLALRGAAVYRKDFRTMLLIPHYYFSGNPAQFDTPAQYLPVHKNAAGIRIGWFTENLEIAYSQGDWRHSIPMAALARFQYKNFSVRALCQIENDNPLEYEFSYYTFLEQLSAVLEIPVSAVTLAFITEATYHEDGKWWLRSEQAVMYKGFTFALREIYYRFKKNFPVLFEASFRKNFYNIASLGIFAATDRRIYLGSEIFFNSPQVIKNENPDPEF
ncbi:MAG: hypothetical protein A2096_11325 [Spirochaetes bacterium GWF1_41_5]|nr:MAG: hypothetical protein A2096_11325 [Spirochaetes bacterium GWF1_41_5]HBE03944.1 hypothetical protein [Spirochaetia bacterium]